MDTLPYIEAGQFGNGAWYNWDTYRNWAGPIKMRLTDVTPDAGIPFEGTAYLTVQLVDTAGNVAAQATLSRVWGQSTSFVTLANWPSPKRLRLRTALNCWIWHRSGGGNVPEQASAHWTIETVGAYV